MKNILLITGGTGSFGNAVLKGFLGKRFDEIRVFSRDEKKQDDMRRHFPSSQIKYFIGDVRDKCSIRKAMKGVSYVFHAAALKQVPSCEFYPIEAVKTNVLGTENVLEVALEAGVKKVVCLSTDKAVYPINAMGISKAMMEKVVIAKSREAIGTETVICCTRYGNVMASRGSVIPLFLEQINTGKPVTVTNPLMTRFMMTLDDAVDLVNFAFDNASNGDIFVQKSPSATIETLLQAIFKLKGLNNYEVKIIGTRHGEKEYEALVSEEEMIKAEELSEYYRIPADNRDLNYGRYFHDGDLELTNSKMYSSHNTKRLTVPEMSILLKKVSSINDWL